MNKYKLKLERGIWIISFGLLITTLFYEKIYFVMLMLLMWAVEGRFANCEVEE